MLAGKAFWGLDSGITIATTIPTTNTTTTTIFPTFSLCSFHFSTQALGQMVAKFFWKNWHGSYSSPWTGFVFQNISFQP